MLHRLARYAIAVSIAGNQLGNALTGGDPGQTISARAGMARDHGSHVGAGVCAVLNVIDHRHERPGEDHCQKAIRHLRERLTAAKR